MPDFYSMIWSTGAFVRIFFCVDIIYDHVCCIGNIKFSKFFWLFFQLLSVIEFQSKSGSQFFSYFMSAASALSCYCNNHIPCLLCDNVAFNLLSKYFFGIIILKKNRNVYAKIYYKLPSQALIFWYLWQIGLTNICLIETLDKYLILRYDENCGSCFAAEQFVDIKCFYNI